MTLHRSTCIPAPEFSHRETEEPVPPQGTLERLLLRTEQTGWSVVYFRPTLSVGGASCGGNLAARRPRAERIQSLEKCLSKARCQRTEHRAGRTVPVLPLRGHGHLQGSAPGFEKRIGAWRK